MFSEKRIKKLEQRTEHLNPSADVTLFDINGNKVDAKILQKPQTWGAGLAVLQNGTEKEIAALGNWSEIILESERVLRSREKSEVIKNKATQEDYSDALFLRESGEKSAMEIIYGKD